MTRLNLQPETSLLTFYEGVNTLDTLISAALREEFKTNGLLQKSCDVTTEVCALLATHYGVDLTTAPLPTSVIHDANGNVHRMTGELNEISWKKLFMEWKVTE